MIFRIKNLINAVQTDEKVSVFEEQTTPGSGPPLHNHRAQLEIFHIIKGQHLFRLGEQEILASSGECVLAPVGIPHTFKNVDQEDGLIHFELMPSGTSEVFFERISKDFDGINDIGGFFAEHGMDLLGPPL